MYVQKLKFKGKLLLTLNDRVETRMDAILIALPI